MKAILLCLLFFVLFTFEGSVAHEAQRRSLFLESGRRKVCCCFFVNFLGLTYGLIWFFMVFYGFLWFSRFSFVYILLFWDRVLVLHSRFGHQTNKKKKKNFKIKKNKKYNNKDIKKKKKKHTSLVEPRADNLHLSI